MTIETLREYCLSLPGATERQPFLSISKGEDILCFYVGDKMFCLVNIEDFSFFNLKGQPEDNIELCERFASITPGWHMNKRHWISVAPDGDVPDKLIKQLTHTSYSLVLSTLPKKIKDEI